LTTDKGPPTSLPENLNTENIHTIEIEIEIGENMGSSRFEEGLQGRRELTESILFVAKKRQQCTTIASQYEYTVIYNI
jgi:hypothetical protein